MIFKITGYKFGSFTDDNGKLVKYSTLFIPVQIPAMDGDEDTYSKGYYTEKVKVGRVISATDVEKIINGSRNVNIEFDFNGKVATCHVVDN